MATIQRGMVEELAFADVRTDPLDGTIKVVDSLRITPTFGPIAYLNLDLGSPDIRDSVQDLPDADGTYDDTLYHGARAVSLDLVCLEDMFEAREITGWNPRVRWNSAAYWVQVIGAWLRPDRRFRLYFKMTGQDRRWIDVRPSGLSAPLVLEKPGSREVQVNLVSPSGRIKSFATAAGSTVDGRNYRKVPYVAAGAQTGATWPWDWTAGVSWGLDAVTPNEFTYSGTVPTGFVVRMHAGTVAPLQNPRFSITGPDGVKRTKGFTMTVPAGSFLTIDSEQRATYLNHDRASSVERYYSDPLTGTSQAWPMLIPGFNPLSLDPRFGYHRAEMSALSAGSDAFYEVLWFDNFFA
jgi:hypothetical protein